MLAIGLRRNALVSLPFILNRLATCQAPDIGIEAAEFFLHLQKDFRIGNGGGNFQPVSNDPRVSQQLLTFLESNRATFAASNAGKYLAVAFAFFQDGVPTQSRLRTFQRQKFKPFSIVVDRHAPLFIVVSNVDFVRGPMASHDPFQVVSQI